MNTLENDLYNKALEYARQKHHGQERIGGTPYITHPIAVAQMLKVNGYGLDYQLAGLFHDLLEDTNATQSEIESLSNSIVLEAVILLTKQKGYNMQKYVEDIRNNPMAKVVKAADRLHNLQSALVASQDFKRRYILETLDWYMDFSPEIVLAVKELAKTLETPMVELSPSYDPIQDWISKDK